MKRLFDTTIGELFRERVYSLSHGLLAATGFVHHVMEQITVDNEGAGAGDCAESSHNDLSTVKEIARICGVAR